MSVSNLHVRGCKVDLSSPKIMGILNVTPDSFSDGGEYNNLDLALQRIEQMMANGADIIDIGGESTRPGAPAVSANQETARVLPVVEAAIDRFPNTIFSIDTTKYPVAEQCLQAGAHIINDVSGLQKDKRLAALCAAHDAGYVLMHAQGTPQTMQKNPSYKKVMDDIRAFFNRQLTIAKDAGLQSIIVDPGIGFGKTLQHNVQIIRQLQQLKALGYPLLVGASRKSMIGEILRGRPIDGRLAGTLAVHYHALCNGASILRVHDVREAKDTILAYNSLSGKQL